MNWKEIYGKFLRRWREYQKRHQGVQGTPEWAI